MVSREGDSPFRVEEYARGVAHYRAGRYAEAIAELEGLRQRDGIPERIAAYYAAMSHRALGIAALRDGRYDAAERHLRAAAGRLGPDADLASYLARLYAQTHRYERCAAEVEKVVDAGPDDPDAHRRLAQAQWRSGRRTEAYMSLNAAVDRFGTDANLHLQLGLFHAAEEDFPAAADAFGRAIDADCSSADAHYYLGLCAAADGDAAGACRSLQRAMDLRTGDLRIAWQLSLAARAAGHAGCDVVVHIREGQPADGDSQIRLLARYVTREPDFIDAFLSLPESDADAELFRLLLGVLETALDEHPRYADLHCRCAAVLSRLGRTRPAIEHLRSAVEINPQYLRARVMLGRMLAGVERAEAVSQLDRAVADGADWADVHCLLGELQSQGNRPKAARGHLERALELNADYTRAVEALESLAA